MKEREFADWLEREMRRRGWSASELARRLGMRRQTVYKWLASERLPEPDSASKLATVLGVHVDAVLTMARIRPQVEPISRFDQEQRIREVEEQLQLIRETALTEGVAIPLIGVVPADSVRWAAVGDTHDTVHVPEAWVDAHGAPLAAVRVSGDCLMSMGVLDGDIVVIERLSQNEVRDGDIVVARINGDYTLKQWRVVAGSVELRDGAGETVYRLSVMDEFELVGVARYRYGRIRLTATPVAG